MRWYLALQWLFPSGTALPLCQKRAQGCLPTAVDLCLQVGLLAESVGQEPLCALVRLRPVERLGKRLALGVWKGARRVPERRLQE